MLSESIRDSIQKNPLRIPLVANIESQEIWIEGSLSAQLEADWRKRLQPRFALQPSRSVKCCNRENDPKG